MHQRSLGEVRDIFETDVYGAIAVTQAMLPLLRGTRRADRERHDWARLVRVNRCGSRRSAPMDRPVRSRTTTARSPGGQNWPTIRKATPPSVTGVATIWTACQLSRGNVYVLSRPIG